jgi:hypothetical protein
VYEAYIKQNCDNEVNVCAATRSKVEKALAEWALKVRPYLAPYLAPLASHPILLPRLVSSGLLALHPRRSRLTGDD